MLDEGTYPMPYIIMKKYLCYVLSAMLSLWVIGCSDKDPDNPDEPTPDNPEQPVIDPNQPVPDPEGTIMVNVLNDGENVYINGFGDIKIDNRNNFAVAKSDTWYDDYGYLYCEYVSLGEVNGLGNIVSIPETGWSDNISVIAGNGYVSRIYDPRSRTYKYVRIYVAAPIEGIAGTISGFTLKCQAPFVLPITPDGKSVSFASTPTRQVLTLSNETTVEVKSQPTWVNVIISGKTVSLTASNNITAAAREGTVVLGNSLGDVEITISQAASENPVFASGEGSASSPYTISTAKQFDNIRSYSYLCFKLDNDIDLSSLINPTSTGWEPIAFSGTFDGCNHKITGLWINSPGRDNIGLFGTINNATIRGIRLELSEKGITGRNNVGGIVGYPSGTSDFDTSISECCVTGNISGESSIGGICGTNYTASWHRTNISRCHYNGDITASKGSGGGIIGSSYGSTTISDCYTISNISVNGQSCYGMGIGGYQVYNCYFVGTITGPSVTNYWGGRYGITSENQMYNGSIHSYYNSELFTMTSGGIPKTGREMKRQATYENWDFTTVWQIEEGKSYPTLRCFNER